MINQSELPTILGLRTNLNNFESKYLSLLLIILANGVSRKSVKYIQIKFREYNYLILNLGVIAPALGWLIQKHLEENFTSSEYSLYYFRKKIQYESI